MRKLISLALMILSGVVPAIALHSSSSQTARSTPEGLQLLRALQDALGGAAQIEAVRDFEETIRAQAWDSKGGLVGQVRKRTRWIRSPQVLRLDQLGVRGTYVLFFDAGTGSGWEIPPDVTSADSSKTDGKPVPLVRGELQFAKAYLSGFELNLWLADRLPGYRVTSPGRDTLRIEHGTEATDFTLNRVTHLPVKSTGVSLADPDRPVPAEMRYAGWKLISGVRFPTQRVNYHSGKKRGQLIVEDLRVNTGLRADDLAMQPADFAPQFRRRRQ